MRGNTRGDACKSEVIIERYRTIKYDIICVYTGQKGEKGSNGTDGHVGPTGPKGERGNQYFVCKMPKFAMEIFIISTRQVVEFPLDKT